jgi:ATP-dependent Clp protease ATP-binding subunit ClpC
MAHEVEPKDGKLTFLAPEGLEREWADASPGGPLHRLVGFLAAVAHAHLAHERVIDEQVASAFRASLRDPSVTSAAHFVATLLTGRKVRAADLLGVVPADSTPARALTGELRDLLRAVRLDSDQIDAPPPRTPELAARREEEAATSAGLLVEFMESSYEGELIVAEPHEGPLALAIAAQKTALPPGRTAYLLRRDGSRHPLHPFVLADATGALSIFWDLDEGRIRYLRLDGSQPEPQPADVPPEELVEHLLKLGAYAEIREWLKAMTPEARSRLNRRNLLYAGFCHYGTTYLRQREPQQAAVELEKAVKLRPDLVLGNLYLAQAHVAQKQLDRAIEILKKHAVLYNRSDRIFELIGDCYRQKKDVTTALRMYEKAAGLNPFNGQVEKKRDLLRDEARRERDDRATQAVASGGSGPAQPVKLDEFLVDMTLEAELGMYSPTVGRESEIRQLVEILSCRDKRNPLLLGDPGVGKTALVEDFVLRLVQRQLPARFTGKKVYLMSVATLLAGAKFRGQFEERVLDLVKALKTQDCILFIDNFHNIVNAGLTRGGTLDTSNILKPFLVKGEIQVVGATTHEEFRQNVEKDVSLLRCFQTLVVEEPSLELAADMVCAVRGRYEAHHRVTLSQEVIRATIPTIDACVRERALPDKAIDVFDRACAVAAIRRAEAGPDADEMVELTREDVLSVLSETSRIPVSRLTEDAREKLAAMESLLARRVIGQPDAVRRVSRVVRAARMQLTIDERRPKGVFLFVGPTGVGKTELARAMAELLFGSDDRLIRIDMSEYMERINQSRLIGTAPGYVGYNDQNQLTDEVRKNPHSLVLLDEIEKADHNMIHLFLQVFDAGRLTDGKGRTVHFDNATIVMTSNVGTQLFSRAAVGYDEGRGNKRPAVSTGDLLREVRRHFPPEFLNRIDEVICFAPLGVEDVRLIARQKIANVVSRLQRQGKRLELSPEAEELLAREGYSYEDGARNLERTIRRLLLEPLASKSLEPDWERATTVVATLGGDGELAFELGEGEGEVAAAEAEAEAEIAPGFESGEDVIERP